VLDLETDRRYCMKIIENNKDYFDQSIDEIKLLQYINHNGDVDEKRVLKIYDFFYHKEHLFIVTELLKDNLYEAYKMCKELGQPNCFTMGRIQRVCKQVLQGLDYIHSLKLIHTDLKPENILLEDRDTFAVKVIDFGSSIYTHDRLSPYIQTRSYRAPEVILGLKYDHKIDIWSLGCIAA
jgi:serine/threonine protein kinase